MSNLLQLFPARVAIGKAKDGTLIYASEEFLRALQKVFERVGGATGPSTTDLNVSDDEDSGLEEFRAEQWKVNDACDMRPPVVFMPADEAMQAELAGLREEVAQLRTLINDILQGTML